MSDARPVFSEQLKAAAEQLAEESLSEAGARRIRRALLARRAESGKRARRVAMLALAVAAGAVLSLGWMKWGPRATVGGLEVSSPSGGFESSVADGLVSVSGGEATLVDKGLRLQARVGRGTKLRRESAGLRVVGGEVTFVAEKRAPSEPPARVLVSGGAIEVIGTRFSVKESGEAGELILYEGVVRFVVKDGRIVSVLPGEAFRWPVPPEPPLSPPPPPPAVAPAAEEADAGDLLAPPPAAPNPPEPDVARPQAEGDWSVHDRLLRARVVLEEVPKLRAEGKGRQALFRIRNALAHDLPATTREQLSAWEAEILEDDLDQPEAACRQWREHLWLFPGGRFEERAKGEIAHGCR